MSQVQYPDQVFLDLNVECNLRCIQCDMHKLRNPTNELSKDERSRIISEIAKWKPGMNLVFTGGEPFIRKELLYELAEIAKKNGLYTTISTNGTLINNHDVELLPDSGVNDVVISIDSHIPAVHDRIRGREGCHDAAVKSIKKLVAAKRSDNFHVLTSTILGSHNLGYIRELAAFIESLGVETSLFQPIQPVFNRPMNNNWWQSNPLFPNEESLIDSGIDTLKLLKKEGKKLYQSEYQFEDMRNYFKSQAKTQEGQCISMHKNLMIDIVGNVRFCFNMERIGLQPLGNVRKDSIKELWMNRDEVRNRMKSCRECCGVMVCHAR